MSVESGRSRTLVVGIGSSDGDDQAGWRVVEELEQAGGAENFTFRVASSPSRLLDWLDGADRLCVCDGCRGLGTPGAIRNWRWPTKELALVAWSGTHDLSLPAVLQLASQLGCLPQQVDVWAVELQPAFGGESVSREVQAAVPEIVKAILAMLRNEASHE